MPLQAKVVQWADNSSAQVFCGFQPKAIIAFWFNSTATGPKVDCLWNMGFASSASEARAESLYSRDNVATSDIANSKYTTNSPLIRVVDYAGTTLVETRITSFDVDGFTPAPITSTGNLITALVLGGSDILNVSTFSIAAANGLGNQDVSLSFTPSQNHVVLFTDGGNGANNTSQAAPVEVYQLLGVCGQNAGAIVQAYNCGVIRNGVNPSNCARRQRASGAAYGRLEVGGTVTHEGSYLGTIASGIRFNATTIGINALYGIVIDGIRPDIITHTTPGATGNSTIGPFAFAPEALLFSHFCHAADAGVKVDGVRNSFGICDRALSQYSTQTMSVDNVTPTQEDSRLTGNALSSWDAGGATLDFLASITAFPPGNNVTANYSNVTSGQEVLAVALGHGPCINVTKANVRGANLR